VTKIGPLSRTQESTIGMGQQLDVRIEERPGFARLRRVDDHDDGLERRDRVRDAGVFALRVLEQLTPQVGARPGRPRDQRRLVRSPFRRHGEAVIGGRLDHEVVSRSSSEKRPL
jgi:hypothetical protein